MNTNKTPSRQTVHARLNKSLGEILTLNTTFSEVPITEICEAIREYGAMVTQEDGTEWSGILCGEIGEAGFEVVHPYFKKPFYMRLTWYKREFSGRYEVVCYIS
jgi:hypothetical protein